MEETRDGTQQVKRKISKKAEEEFVSQVGEYEAKSQLHKQGWKDCVHILHGKVIDCFKAISAKEEYPQ